MLAEPASDAPSDVLSIPAAGIGKARVAAAILVGVIANCVSITLPVFLTVLAHSRGLSEVQSGLFAMASLGGVAIGATACALRADLVRRLNLRRTAGLGLAILILANILMAMPTGFAVLFLLSLVAGIGSGLVNAVLYVVLAESGGAGPVAAFNAAQLALGAIGIPLFSAIAALYGGAGLFLLLALLTAGALLLSRAFPVLAGDERDRAADPGDGTDQRISGLGWAAVLGMLAFFIGTGATFGFLAYMGLAWGGAPAAVESAVSDIMIIALAGALLVAFMGSRFGYVWPLIVGVCGILLSLGLFIAFRPVNGFMMIAGLFYFSSNIAAPYLLDALTDVDHSSGAPMMMGGTQMAGLAIGPAIAGYLVTPDYVPVNGFALLLTGASLLIVLAVVGLHRRHEVPA